jgi:hypothetical protein
MIRFVASLKPINTNHAYAPAGKELHNGCP